MSTEVIVAVISGCVTVMSVIIANIAGYRSTDVKLDKQQAITETKLDALTTEVRRHNDFASRIPVLEDRIKAHEHRIEALERSRENT